MDAEALHQLCDRARDLAYQLEVPDKQKRCLNMVQILLENPTWPDLKIGGWLEHITTVCIENGVTTIDTERAITRPIKHAYYRRLGIEIPETIDLSKRSTP